MCEIIKKSPDPGLFFSLSFTDHNFNYSNLKSIDGVLGIRTRGRRIEVADETTELMRQPDIRAIIR